MGTSGEAVGEDKSGEGRVSTKKAGTEMEVQGMSIERVRRLLRQREDIRLEFKEAKAELPETLFETICAMLNRDGGDILLGVADDGVVKGVNPSKVETLTTNLVNLSNNAQKLDPPFILFPLVHEIEGKITGKCDCL